MSNHPDSEFVEKLCSGLVHGFDAGIDNCPSGTLECGNNRSAKLHPQVVEELIQSEIEKGYLLGPFKKAPFETYRISPIGIAEGKYSKKKRLIVDLSAPYDNENIPSINELIDKDLHSLSYVTVDDAIELIKKAGVGAMLSKLDICDAFKLIPLSPGVWHLFGIKWKNLYYFYKRLVFGCRSSPKIFDQLSVAICWIAMNNYKVDNVIHLLDDFLAVDNASEKGYRTMAVLSMIFNKLHIPLSAKKTVGPVTELEYLGIILDSVNMLARLPLDKVQRLIEMLHKYSKMESCTKVKLLSLLGHMSFASKVVVPGRSFMSYLLKLIRGKNNNHDIVFFNDDCRRDMKMWLSFLQNWNGVSFFIHSVVTNDDIELYTDASSTKGFGGYFAGKWFQDSWPEELSMSVNNDKSLSMALLELYPIVMAAILWGKQWTKKRIIFNCDNLSCVYILRKGRSPCSNIMLLMRRLTWLAATNNFSFYAEHVRSEDNGISDSISRFQMDRFRRLAPNAEKEPVPCVPYQEVIYP